MFYWERYSEVTERWLQRIFMKYAKNPPRITPPGFPCQNY
jgi:hypothetical protein